MNKIEDIEWDNWLTKAGEAISEVKSYPTRVEFAVITSKLIINTGLLNALKKNGKERTISSIEHISALSLAVHFKLITFGEAKKKITQEIENAK